MSAGGGELHFDLRGRNSRSFMKHLKWDSDFIKEGFNTVVYHLEISRIKNDARRVAMFEQHFLGEGEIHLINVARWLA